MTRRRLYIFLAALALICSSFYASRSFWQALPAKILISDSQPEPGADGIIYLSGDITTRLPKAAALYKQGLAPRIFVAQVESYYMKSIGITINEATIAQKQLTTEYQVPTTAIEFVSEPTVTSTIEEAKAILGYIQSHYPQGRRFVLVTTWSHTARAHWIFQRLARPMNINMEVVPAYPKDFDIALWWRSEDAFLAVFNEYLKWAYYLINYL